MRMPSDLVGSYMGSIRVLCTYACRGCGDAGSIHQWGGNLSRLELSTDGRMGVRVRGRGRSNGGEGSEDDYSDIAHGRVGAGSWKGSGRGRTIWPGG